MKEGALWGTSIKGNVYKLDITNSTWEQVPNQGKHLQGFKKVVGGPAGAWGLGCDHLVYVYVNSTDIPIRVQESIWENERWIPIQGWSKRHLLPVDPQPWSNEEGSVHVTKQSVTLPSSGWAWEADWKIDDNVKGFQTDSEGWRYSNIDFYHGFSHKKTFKSCVRRRHWIRYRTFIATDTWTKVEPLHVDPLEEPITDLSAGGHDLPNMAPGFTSIWITSVSGRVLFRAGVTSECPQGTSWQSVDTVGGEEVTCVAVGRCALLWALTWQGAILARQGLTWQQPKGESWIQVPMPEHLGERDKISQVAAGTHAAWVISSEGQVWLRKGISEENELGTGWLQMQHKLKSVSLAAHDKAFGIDLEERQITFRSGITKEEPSGKAWNKLPTSFHSLSTPDSSPNHIFSGPGHSRPPFYRENTLTEQDLDAESLASSDISGMQVDASENSGNIDDVIKNDDTNIELDDIHLKEKASQLNASALSDLDAVDDLDLLGSSDDLESSHNLESNYGRLSFSRDDSAADLSLNLDLKETVLPSESDETTPTNSPSKSKPQGDGLASNVQKSSENGVVASETENKDSKDTDSKPFMSFKKLRSNFGGRFKNPKEVIDKIKSTKPKEFFKDIKSDVTDQKNHIVSQMKQAQSVILGETKLDKPEKMAVSFQKSTSIDDETGLKLTFTQAEEEDEDKSAMQLSTANSEVNAASVEQENGNYDTIVKSESHDSLTAGLQQDVGTDDSVSMCSENISLGPEEEVLDPWIRYRTQPDVDDITWAWVSASALNVQQDTDCGAWFNKESESKRYQDAVSQSDWRKRILESVRVTSRECRDNFNTYESAVEKSGWTKTGELQLWPPGNAKGRGKWVKCGVELLQDSEAQDTNAFLTLTYTWRNQEQGIFLDLRDVECVRRVMNESKATVFCIQSADRRTAGLTPYTICAPTEEAMQDWMNQVVICCREQHRLQGAPVPPLMCAVTQLGDVFLCQRSNAEAAYPEIDKVFWQQVGGHLRCVETSESGVAWAVGHDNKAYAFTGSYGGAFFKGAASSSYGVHNMTDSQMVYIYENQRWRLGKGYTGNVYMASHHPWSDVTGRVSMSREKVKLPSKHWSWRGDWHVDYSTSGGVDKEGWQYARHHNSTFYPRPRMRAYIRRRRWARRCEVHTSGPWREVAPLALSDVCVQTTWCDGGEGRVDEVLVWAVGTTGDLMYREGVTAETPMGKSWSHVSTDLKYRAVSVDRGRSVWALSQDGAVAHKQGCTWSHIAPPNRTHFTQISAGHHCACAVDSRGHLWVRKGITAEVPTGADWQRLCANVSQASVTTDDHIYVVSSPDNSPHGEIWCAEYKQGSDFIDLSWQRVTDDGFVYVSARGWKTRILDEKETDKLQSEINQEET